MWKIRKKILQFFYEVSDIWVETVGVVDYTKYVPYFPHHSITQVCTSCNVAKNVKLIEKILWNIVQVFLQIKKYEGNINSG